jgi:hypothetical protein
LLIKALAKAKRRLEKAEQKLARATEAKKRQTEVEAEQHALAAINDEVNERIAWLRQVAKSLQEEVEKDVDALAQVVPAQSSSVAQVASVNDEVASEEEVARESGQKEVEKDIDALAQVVPAQSSSVAQVASVNKVVLTPDEVVSEEEVVIESEDVTSNLETTPFWAGIASVQQEVLDGARGRAMQAYEKHLQGELQKILDAFQNEQTKANEALNSIIDNMELKYTRLLEEGIQKAVQTQMRAIETMMKKRLQVVSK